MVDVVVDPFEPACDTLYVFFDGQRIGSGHPRTDGSFVKRRLTIPRGAQPGRHTLSAACDADADGLVRQASFVVRPSAAHRSSFLTTLPRPDQLDLSAAALASSLALTAALLLLVAFPCNIFNSCFEEHYEEIRSWFRLKERDLGAIAATPRWRQLLSFVAFLLAGGMLYSLLSPDAGFDRSTLSVMLGMAVGLLAVTFAFSIPVILYMRSVRSPGTLRALSGGLVVTALCVLLSRLLHFQPGYLYGLIAGLAYQRRLGTNTEGRLTALSDLGMIVVSLTAWAVWARISTWAPPSGPGLGLIAGETALATVFAFGLETAVFGLLPLRFMAGEKVVAWSRPAWVGTFGLGMLAFVHILLRPGTGYVSTTSGRGARTMVLALVGFGIASIALWSYFRYRPARAEPAEQGLVGTAGPHL